MYNVVDFYILVSETIFYSENICCVSTVCQVLL